MSDDTKRPSHIAYHVREDKEGKAYFNRVGSAFAHKDGEGFNVILDAVPVDGNLTLRTPKERVDEMRSSDAKRTTRSRRRSNDYGRD
ncbi:MAG: hypothetical protein AAF724_14915 [Pseudomonadota bacterium]